MRSLCAILVVCFAVTAGAQDWNHPERTGLSPYDRSAERVGWRPCDRIQLFSDDPALPTEVLRQATRDFVQERYIVLADFQIGAPDVILWYETNHGTGVLTALYVRTRQEQRRTGYWRNGEEVAQQAAQLMANICDVARGRTPAVIAPARQTWEPTQPLTPPATDVLRSARTLRVRSANADEAAAVTSALAAHPDAARLGLKFGDDADLAVDVAHTHDMVWTYTLRNRAGTYLSRGDIVAFRPASMPRKMAQHLFAQFKQARGERPPLHLLPRTATWSGRLFAGAFTPSVPQDTKVSLTLTDDRLNIASESGTVLASIPLPLLADVELEGAEPEAHASLTAGDFADPLRPLSPLTQFPQAQTPRPSHDRFLDLAWAENGQLRTAIVQVPRAEADRIVDIVTARAPHAK